MASDISFLLEKILAFRDDRDWEQFHNVKDLAAGLAIEAAELQELFLWKNGSDINAVLEAKREKLSDELADIAWFLFLLSHETKIDLPAAILSKLEKNNAKYPADTVRGSSKKYNEYENTTDDGRRP